MSVKIELTRTRFGWESRVAYSDPDLWISMHTEPPWWRPTKRAAIRVAKRYAKREARNAYREEVMLPY